uniref:Uncharacterized protein n=1 Tax=Myotis lucifugus TaxID=59463 RepID=G1NV65_MYOLU
MVAGKGVGGGKLGTRREGSERPGPARVGAPQDAGCSRPDGCCSGRGLEEGGTGKREDSAAGPGTRQRDPREPPLCPSLASGQRAVHKGAGEPEALAARGTAGSAQQGGAVGAPPPRQPRPPEPPRPHPAPTAPPRRSTSFSSYPNSPSVAFPTPFLRPHPYSQSLGRFPAALFLGTGKPAENANPRGAVSGPLSQGPERTAGCDGQPRNALRGPRTT